MPKFSLLFIIFVLGGLGLQIFSGFVGEFLVLLGAFKKNYLVAILASIGVILAAAYMLWLAKRVVFGEVKNDKIKALKDMNFSESFVLLLLIFSTLFFGFYPDPILDTISVSVSNLIDNHELEIVSYKIGMK